MEPEENSEQLFSKRLAKTRYAMMVRHTIESMFCRLPGLHNAHTRRIIASRKYQGALP